MIDVAMIAVVLAARYVGWMAVRFLRDRTGFRLLPASPLWPVILIGVGVQGDHFGSDDDPP